MDFRLNGFAIGFSPAFPYTWAVFTATCLYPLNLDTLWIEMSRQTQ